jgi:nicotinamidase-related amidase
MESKLHDWVIEPREYARQEARRGRRHAFTSLVPARTAVVVIDMVGFFVAESAYCRGIVPNLNALAAAMRGAGGLVVWVLPGDAPRHPGLMAEFYGAEIAELFRRSGAGGLWAGMAREAGDWVAEKQSASAFLPGYCDLPERLRAAGIDTVVIGGTVTNVCCESSARDAFSTGFRVIMLADGCAARRDQDHNATLHTVYRSFGDVRTVREVIGLLEG